MKQRYLLFALSFFYMGVLNAQTNEKDEQMARMNSVYENDDKNYRFRFQFSTQFLIHGGFSMSFSVGSWVRYQYLQPALNVSTNLYCGRNNIGNSNAFYTDEITRYNPNRTLFNVTVSPMLTAGWDTYYYEELNPFYSGNSTSIYNNFKYALTLGTTFVASPRGTYSNIMTSRNRTQQLLYIQAKTGCFMLNLQEDYFVITENVIGAVFSDNRDRYYTGGGNIQIRIPYNPFSPWNPYFKLKIYSEMYTGTSYVDKQEFPDIAYYKQHPHRLFRYRGKRKNNDPVEKKIAYQDPGQSLFNRARNFVVLEFNTLEITDNPYQTNSHVQLFVGTQGGFQNMWQQNGIHNANKVNCDNLNRNGKSGLHQFDYSDNYFPRLLLGFGTTVNY